MYGGKNIRVQGAPAHFDMAGLIVELLASFDATLVGIPKKLSGFLLMRLAKLGLASGGADLAKAYRDLSSRASAPRAPCSIK